MKQSKLPGRRSQAYNILSLIAISGELPADQIQRLPGGNAYKIKLIRIFKQKKFIKTFYKDKLRGHRLTVNSRNILAAENNERFESLFTGRTETNQPKNEINRRLRLKSIAETFVTMQNSGVSIFKDEKPDVFCPDKPNISLSVTSPSFYSSREIKCYGLDFVQIRGTRSVGILLTESDYFVVYNTCGSLMKWERQSEIKTSGLISYILCRKLLPHQYRLDKESRGLILGDTMEQFYQLITNKNNVSKKSFVLDQTYNSFLYLPNDCNGETVLRLLCDPEKTKELNYILSQDLYEHDPNMIVENDAVDKNGYPVLFAYDCDMPRIFRFNSALKTYNRKGIIICFDFQSDVLKRYCCDNVIFEPINTDKFKRRFFP